MVGLSISRGRQVGRVGHPTTGAIQFLMKGNAFTWRNANLTKLPCSVLSNKRCAAVHPGGVQNGQDVAPVAFLFIANRSILLLNIGKGKRTRTSLSAATPD